MTRITNGPFHARDPETGRMMKIATDEERFMSKILINGECLEWTGKKNKLGYGYFNLSNNGKERTVLAYRWAYERWIGPLPEGLVFDHLCRNPSCVRLDHLELVPQAVNFLRGNHPGAVMTRTGKCSNGHEMTEENTYYYTTSNGKYTGRDCRICNREQDRKYRERKRLEKKAVVQ